MSENPRTELSRDLGVFTITMVGVGAMIGAGIFVLTGIAAGTAGPGLILAFAANGVVTFLTAFAYAELGSAIPEAGGGYLWVKEGLPGPNAFLAGWMSWFAHAVAGSLYALGFASYLGFVLQELGMQTVAGIPIEGALFHKGLAVLIALAFVAINFKGVSETGLAGNIVTVAKVVIIGIFIASGLYTMIGDPVAWDRFTPFTPQGLSGVFSAMGLTYIAFEGYEIIVQAGEEVKNPKKNIPRAVFWSLAIVIPIYILVSLTAVGAVDTGSAQPTWQWLGNAGELGLAEAARQFMPLGTTLLLTGGILSTMSALNATTFSSTRVSFAMGRDRNLPDLFAEVHESTRTPYLALLASGSLIILMALSVPIEDVAAAADVMFLLLFLQVNIAIITIRRKYGDKLDYGFLIPFFPITPIVAIVLMLGLAAFMFHFSPIAWYFVIGWIGVGFAIYYTYARKREREKRATPVVLQQQAIQEKEGYRVLIPVANPETAEALIDFGATLAKQQNGEVMLLHVITVPRQSPYEVAQSYVRRARDEVLDEAVRMAEEAHDVPVHSVIRVARKPAPAIVDQVEENDVDMVVMGWRGRSKHPETTIGSNIDTVLRNADCDVTVFRGEDIRPVERVLVPMSYPDQAHLMLELGDLFANDQNAEVDLFHILPRGLSDEEQQKRLSPLYEGLADLEVGPQDESEARRAIQTEVSGDVVRAIVNRSADYDLLIIGADREGWVQKLVAGAIPERIAQQTQGRLLLVKHRRTPVQATLLDTIEFFRRTEPDTVGEV